MNSICSNDSSSSLSSSSGIPSLSSAVSDPTSQPNIGLSTPESSCTSLGNYLSASTSTITLCQDEDSESSEEEMTEESSLPDKLSRFVEEKSRMDNVHFDPLPSVDPQGWIKFSRDPDPWNEAYYEDDDDAPAEDGVLTHEIVREGLTMMAQLPDTKRFALTRLHIRRKELTEAGVLSEYRYLQTVDVSDNQLTDLWALRSYHLLYLNASRNRLTAALDPTSPPAFLTRADLAHNLIQDTGPHLGLGWSLCHLDLSHNRIEHIRGLAELRYLRHLNLAHNQIRSAEGLECESLEWLSLEGNQITDAEGLSALLNIREINVTGNKLTTLQPFKELYRLRRLAVGDNLISDLQEVDNLSPAALRDLDLSTNPVTTGSGYRQYVLWRLPGLRLLDNMPVSPDERVAAKQLLRPDVGTRGDQLRAKAELWAQLAAPPVDASTVGADQPPLPLVVLVGTFANGRDTVAKQLTRAYPQRVYRCKKFTTMPSDSYYDPESVVSVTQSEFNDLVRTGRLLVHYREIGAAFGIGREELCHCVMEDKVCVVDLVLEAALALCSLSLRPALVLAVSEDSVAYAERLRELYGQMGLWGRVRQEPEEVIKEPSIDEDRLEKTPWAMQSRESALDDEQADPNMTLKESQENISGNEFVWSWSLESSRESLEPEPRESVVAAARGQDRLVRDCLSDQQAYIDLHNARPGLFQESVITDDVEKAVRKITKTCGDIFKMREAHNFMDECMEDLDCKEFLEARVSHLMKDLLNVAEL